ncbi:MAG: class I adenylate-forming enzyme family protein [Chloroflexota bacterium]
MRGPIDLAHWLQSEAGIGQGDRVAILARDGVEHLDTFFACGKLGAIHTALNWRLHWRELAEIMANTTPKVLIYSDEFSEAVTHLQNDEQAASLTHFVHMEGAACRAASRLPKQWRQAQRKPLPPPPSAKKTPPR